MAQKIEIMCDRCGKEIFNPMECYCPTYALKNYSAKITLWGVGEPRSSFGQRIDLCPECYEKFVNLWKVVRNEISIDKHTAEMVRTYCKWQKDH